MLYRLIIVLGCLVLFVNSCNSLISGFTGTHKLRTFTMEEVEQEGVGDADYVEITNAWRTGYYEYAPPRKGEKAGAIQYPVVSQERMMQLDSNLVTRIAVVAWTQAYDPACVDKGTCATKGPATIKGIVRKIPRSKNKVKEFPENYDVSQYAVYVETDRAPLEWFWHAGLMGLAILLGVSTEYFYNRRQRKVREKTQSN